MIGIPSIFGSENKVNDCPHGATIRGCLLSALLMWSDVSEIVIRDKKGVRSRDPGTSQGEKADCMTTPGSKRIK